MHSSKEWVTFTCFIRPEVHARVQEVIRQLKLCGISVTGDQSEIVVSWLNVVEPLLAQARMLRLQRAAAQAVSSN